MNASATAMKATGVLDTKEVATEVSLVQRTEDMQSRIQEIQSAQLRSQLEKQNELIKSLEKLSSLDDVEERERQRRIIDSELSTVRAEIAKRQENVGVLAFELFGLYDELGMQAMTAKEDTAADKSKRAAAQAVIDNARRAVGKAEAELTALDLTDVASAASIARAGVEGDWNPFGKAERVAAFDAQNATDVATAQTKLKEAEEAVTAAETSFIEVEAQIEIDKADRVRKQSLSENFALIAQFTKQATTLLREDIAETEALRVITEKALNSALTAKSNTARELDAAKDEIGRQERDLQREQKALNEIPDQGSEAYAIQQQAVAEIEQTLIAKRGEELMLNTKHMSLTAAIEANKSSLAGLVTQRDTAEVFVIKLETAEKTAHILGKNIDRMVKNSLKETATDALDRASDKMILTAFDLGIQAEVASGRIRNDAIARHDAMMAKLTSARGAGDQAMATEAARYLELDQKIRQGYADRGVDVEMSHLEAAAASFEARQPPASSATTDAGVTY